jgi:hypothetical protein
MNIDYLRDISNSDFKAAGGTALLKRYKTLRKVLETFMEVQLPQKRRFFKGEGFMAHLLHEIFSGHNVLVHYHHPDILYASTLHRAELDVFISDLSIAFEYQGERHYKSISIWGNSDSVQKHDAEKKAGCQRLGITLIEVSFRQPVTRELLREAIHKVRPDLLAEKVP